VRYIAANTPPQELIDWTAQQRAAGVNLHFDHLGQVPVGGVQRDVKLAIKTQRLRDQGFLCAYTLWPIDDDEAHIEHIIPRATSDANGQPEQTVEYDNMVACYPLNGGDTRHGFGAAVRGTTPLVVTPRQANCATRFMFTSDGKVGPRQADDHPVRTMIDTVLCLNAGALVSRRRAAYRGANIGVDAVNPLSRAAAQRLATEILVHSPGGRLNPFCEGVAQVALDHILRLDKRAAKRQAIAQQQIN
jgi:uncharacterized protein (TIGR02646 family)